MRAERAARLAATLVVAGVAGYACERLRVPLPWMIGPLLATALTGLAGIRLAASGRLRNVGQWMIGITLGLYFTPQALGLLVTLGPALVAGVSWALLLGHGFYRFLWWRHGNEVDRASAFFAAAIGGASEMALMAERAGGKVERVAAAHSLRVLMVVVAIPLAYQALGVHGADPAVPAMREVRWPGLVLLLAMTAAAALVLQRWRLPNPWVLGALAVTLVLTATGVNLSALPRAATNAGQLFIGVALGTRFTPGFARAAPRWLASVAVGTVAMMAASAAFALALAAVTGLHPATVLLATSPGGIAEMSITATVLQLGAPVVTTFHAVRYVAVLLLTGPLYRAALARETARAD